RYRDDRGDKIHHLFGLGRADQHEAQNDRQNQQQGKQREDGVVSNAGSSLRRAHVLKTLQRQQQNIRSATGVFVGPVIGISQLRLQFIEYHGRLERDNTLR